MMRAMIWTDALQPSSSAKRSQHRRMVRVLLPAERVLHDSTLIDSVLEALFDRLHTTTVVVCVRRPSQDARP